MKTIKWSEIIAQCGNYREGFVAIFRQYEGQATDEKDGAGRVVKVTMNSFAEHMSIPSATFRRWVINSTGDQRRGDERDRVAEGIKRTAPDAVVAGIMAAPPAVQDQIFHNLKLERAGIDTSLPARKAAGARADHAVEPIRNAISNMKAQTNIAFCIQALEEAAQYLADAKAEGPLSAEDTAAVQAAHDRITVSLMEAGL